MAESTEVEAGAPIAKDAIRTIAREAGHALVFVDEAYHDFLGENFLSEAPEYPNVLVGRTFSKAYGLAGMRVGGGGMQRRAHLAHVEHVDRGQRLEH